MVFELTNLPFVAISHLTNCELKLFLYFLCDFGLIVVELLA